MHIDGMIYLIEYGSYLSHIYLEEKDSGEGRQKITEDSSMQYFGYCAQELPGEICRLIMVIGVILTGGLLVGEIKESGLNSLKF